MKANALTYGPGGRLAHPELAGEQREGGRKQAEAGARP